jgi:hypothetical protein
MLVAIVMPEWLVGKAMEDFVAAYRSSRCEEMKRNAASPNGWTITHAFYANMGGVILQRSTNGSFNAGSAADSSTNGPSDAGCYERLKERVIGIFDYFLCGDKSEWRMKHNKWPFVKASINVEPLEYDPIGIAVNAAHLCMLVRNEIIQGLPAISEQEIEDKSKEDIVVKALALCQVTWFFVQVVVRAINGLLITQLEIAVIGFTTCATISYILWIKKPKDIKVPTNVYLAVDEIDSDTKERIVNINQQVFFQSQFRSPTYPEPAETVPNDIYNLESRLFSWKWEDDRPTVEYEYFIHGQDLGFIFGAVVFGSCHCIAWNFHFPTKTEQILWRVASVFTTAAVPGYYLIWFGIWSTPSIQKREKLYKVLTRGINDLVYIFYILCRMYILVEIFRDLAYLPPHAFVATWTSAIPNIN